MTQGKKTACIYHSIDLDGWMSAAIVKHWFNQINDYPDNVNKGDIDFIGYNYGKPIPDVSKYTSIIMCDVCFPKENMQAIADDFQGDNFIWCDHHISAINENDDLSYVEGIRHTKFSACELTWMYFFPSFSSASHWIDMPEIVRLLGRYDCFGHKGTDDELKVLEFQYGARSCISSYEEAYEELLSDVNNPGVWINEIHEKGKSIYQYLCTEAKQSYKNGFEIKIDDTSIDFSSRTDIKMHPKYKFICINKERFNPINFGIDYHKDGYDGAACFHYDGQRKLWSFSLYNDNNKIDCSQLAKQFGGGGHKGAAGFVINDIENIFKLKSK